MLDIGGWEFLIVAFVLLMVVGPKELPKMLRGFTRAMRQVRSMASEFTRGMEDLATDSELGDLKNTIADVKSGNLTGIADKIDPAGELKESVVEIKSSADLDATSATPVFRRNRPMTLKSGLPVKMMAGACIAKYHPVQIAGHFRHAGCGRGSAMAKAARPVLCIRSMAPGLL